MDSPAPARMPHAHPALPYIIGGLSVVVLVAAYLVFANMQGWWPREVSGPNKDSEVFCTLDAKLCPDGSYVGRVGPNCEFTACP